MADIDIKAGLGQTTATGPGSVPIPELNLDKYDLPQSLGDQLRYLRKGFSYGGNPTMINQGLRGGIASPPPTSNFGGFSQAPMSRPQPVAPAYVPPQPQGMDVKYIPPGLSRASLTGPSQIEQQQAMEMMRRLQPVKRADFPGGGEGA